MGNASYSHMAYTAHTHSTTVGKTRAQIFTEREIHKDLDPTQFKVRECVDSPANPEVTPIILVADETGSMGELAEEIIRGSLGDIMNALYNTKPVSNPQILCGGVGDVYSDRAPLQVTQFEADGVVLAEQIKKIYLEGNGGGNDGESYPIVWAFAAFKTKLDNWDKRGKRGYIFTIGDEQPHTTPISSRRLKEFTGIEVQGEQDAVSLLKAAREKWHVFHLIVKPVGHQPVLRTWKDLLGECAIEVEDIKNLATGIVTTIQVVEGHDPRKGVVDKHEVRVIEAVRRQLTAGA